MSALDRIRDLIPPPYTIEDDSVLSGLIDGFALECDSAQEDIDRMRRTHWVRQAYRFEDLRRIGALFDIEPLTWENLKTYRLRLITLIAARLSGALGPSDIRKFVHDYLVGAEDALKVTLILGLRGVPEDSVDPWQRTDKRKFFEPLELAEFPLVTRRSKALAARGGFVPVLYRWTETNRGLEDSTATFRIMGMGSDRTAIPVLLNITTGDMILYHDRLTAGALLEISLDEDAENERTARATVNGADVTHKLRSVSGVELGRAETLVDLDESPQLPRFRRGDNEWIFLSVGFFDLPALDRTFFALADGMLREGRFDETQFDQSLFPSGSLAYLDMSWVESEPASFEVRVPRNVVSAPSGRPDDAAPYDLVADALRRSLQSLHAAGVRARLRFMPFTEQQPQFIRTTFSWMRPDPETGSAGTRDELSLGMHFGETKLGRSRFE